MWLAGIPDHYWDLLGELPDDVFAASPEEPVTFAHVFATEIDAAADGIARAKGRLAPDGMVWVSWPKKASGVQTELDENGVRRLGLAAGLVDVKICAVDETWSGLKFVLRLRDRPS